VVLMVFRRKKVKRFLIASMMASSFCGLATTANATAVAGAARPINVPTAMLPQDADTPYVLSKLQNEIRVLQAEVQTLGSVEGQASGSARYIFNAEPPPNSDGSPVPTGG
jgi:hypothetical protein